MLPHLQLPEARCPRCDYDLRGAVSTWSTACPIDGQCGECGLSFEWADLFSVQRAYPRWSVEHVRRRWEIPVATVRTLVASAVPWWFWSRFKMTHEVRRGRLAAYLTLVVGGLYLVFALAVGVRAGAQARNCGGSLQEVIASSAYAALLPLSRQPPGWYLVAAPVASPQASYRYQWLVSSGAQIPADPIDLAVEFVIDPWRMPELRGHVFGYGTPSGWASRFEIAIGLALFYSTPILTTPLGLIALPVSLRRARVRIAHIVRITAYSAVLMPLLLSYTILCFAALDYEFRVADLNWLFVRVVPVFIVLWWLFALRRYLKLPHAPAVTLAIVIIGVLLGPGLSVVALMAGATAGWWT